LNRDQLLDRRLVFDYEYRRRTMSAPLLVSFHRPCPSAERLALERLDRGMRTSVAFHDVDDVLGDVLA